MTTTRKRPYKPSAAAIAMLQNMATPGLPPMSGLRGHSEHGGAAWTWVALFRHGLRDENGITAEGYVALAKARADEQQERSACAP